MRTFIAIASSAIQHVSGLLSCMELQKRDGDKPFILSGSHGYVARHELGMEFLDNKEFDAILFLDADMRHPEDALEQLRSHDLDMVSGHYFKRQTDPMQSALLSINPYAEWPCLPFVDIPTELTEIASGGFGISLIKRRVVEAVRGEFGDDIFTSGPVPGIDENSPFGSDVRFFLMARRLGFRAWLDPNVESLHATTVWLGKKAYEQLREDDKLIGAMMGIMARDVEANGVSLEAFRARKNLLEQYRKAIIRQRLDPAKASGDQAKLAYASVQLYKTDARIEEMDEWISWYEKYPRVDSPGLLPETETEGVLLAERKGHPDVRDEKHAREIRDGVLGKVGRDFVEELQKTGDGPGRDEAILSDRGGSGDGRLERQESGRGEPDGSLAAGG